MKERILIRPDFDFYLTDSEGVAIELEELKDKKGMPVYLPALEMWAEEMKPIVLASELGKPYDKDWLDYHTRGLKLARQLRSILSNDYMLFYEAPFEDKSGIVSSSIRIEENISMEQKSEIIDILRAYKPGIMARYGITRLGLFGSVARGQHHEGSDIDVCFEGGHPTLLTIARMEIELEELMGSKVHVTVYHDGLSERMKERINEDVIWV